MSTQGTTAPGSTNTSNPPPRSRKTHSSQGVITALRNMPSQLKRKMNEEIKARNALRELRHAKHVENPAVVADASDSESYVTVSDAEDSPATRGAALLSKLSPASIKDFLRAIPGFANRDKRQREDDTESRKAAKKIREEISLQPGMSLPVAFHSLLFDLYSHDVYLPISLFTSPNLEVINTSAATLTMRKLNAPVPGAKQPQVLDTDVFERAHGTELNLDRGQWIEASRNYVTFIEEASGGADSPESARWNTHFGYFERVENAQDNYPAILACDIHLRKKYISIPFRFDTVLYAREIDQAVGRMHLRKVESLIASSSSSGSRSGGDNSGGDRGGAGSASRGRGGRRGGAPPPFREGNGGDAPAPVCLICARRGHFWNGCSATSFEDNTPLFGVGRAPDICAVRSGQTLCRAWNTKGGAARCSHEAGLRAHICTFCGSRDHHTFAWSCRRNPQP
ncbi:hypothetical protein FB451DRAFT_1485857 [Mycena latifolia]|nr:hypothetical protein FB451DRAFT_1485857 [Mycena latifolia]